MKITHTLLAACTAVLMSATPLYAGPFYMGVNAGASRLKDFCSSAAAGFDCKNTTPVYELAAGYQPGSLFGFELAIGNYGSPQTQGPLFGSTLAVKQQLTGVKLSATLSYPLSSSFAVTGKLGAAFIKSSVSATNSSGTVIEPYTALNNSLAYGVGIQYNFNEMYALRLQYENLGKVGDDTIGTDNLSMLTLGFTYNFSKLPARPYPARRLASPSPEPSPSIRILVVLEHAPLDGKQKLEAAIAQTCVCQPAFVRLQGVTSLVYQISLPQGQDFSSFRNAMLGAHAALGMKDLVQNL